MVLTLRDMTPIGLCIATDGLFDAERFRSSFGDNILLRSKDERLSRNISRMKRDMNTLSGEEKFLNGHKAAIVGNIDKIVASVSRYVKFDLRSSEQIVEGGKEIIQQVMNATSFAEIAAIEPDFKRKVMLPVYSLFIKESKRDGLVV